MYLFAAKSLEDLLRHWERIFNCNLLDLEFRKGYTYNIIFVTCWDIYNGTLNRVYEIKKTIEEGTVTYWVTPMVQ
jgi:hypothetical protein